MQKIKLKKRYNQKEVKKLKERMWVNYVFFGKIERMLKKRLGNMVNSNLATQVTKIS